ncbi:MAG: aldo/keto reductase [Eubacterium sp.]|nr:aldo/keto reductase [Eubacterium sp.]
MNKLGFGFMRMPLTDPNNQKSIDIPQLEKMVDTFFEAGFTYCDTAWMYHDFYSEDTVGKVVVGRYPREAFTIATKMPVAMLKSHEKGVHIFDAQKEKLGVDYFDYYLAHDMTAVNYENAKKHDILTFLQQKKEEGEIRQLGVSVHDTPEYIDRMLTENPYFDFVQLQINYLDWESKGIRSRECYEVCVKHEKPVIVMEPVKGGILANIPGSAEEILRKVHPDWSPASWAIRFAASLPAVKIVLSGMSTLAQVQENTALVSEMEPLTDSDREVLKEAVEVIRDSIAIPCTGCRYCVEESQCPKRIPIPNYFSLYNTEKMVDPRPWSPEQEYYANFVSSGSGRASECIACRACERVCPQHIEISERMKEVKTVLEDHNFILS